MMDLVQQANFSYLHFYFAIANQDLFELYPETYPVQLQNFLVVGPGRGFWVKKIAKDISEILVGT